MTDLLAMGWSGPWRLDRSTGQWTRDRHFGGVVLNAGDIEDVIGDMANLTSGQMIPWDIRPLTQTVEGPRVPVRV